jgi:tetratricopeptide (TPR) repeat protein
MRIPTIVLVLTFAIGIPGQASAGIYDDCVALTATDPAQAENQATRWIQSGGGAPARHCRALAMLALGAEYKAAGLMVAIATDDRTLPDEVRADMLIEAGEIYLGLGELSLGSSVVTQALSLAPEPRAALTLSAQLKAAQGDWRGAVGDLNDALSGGQSDADLLVLRASARRRLGDQVAARADLSWAAELAPDLASIWLEQGILEAASQNPDAARAAWLKAIELSNDEDGVVGEAARLRLQRMEADRAAVGN